MDALPLDPRNIAATNVLTEIDHFSKVPHVWTYMTRGVNSDEMVGRDICLKYLHIKMRITFPQAVAIPATPYFRVMHGWVMMPGCPRPEDGSGNTVESFKTDVDIILKREFAKVLEGPDRSIVRLLSDKVITRKGVNTIGTATSMQRLPIDLHFKWAPNRVMRYDSKLHSGTTQEFIPDTTKGLWIPFYVVWQQTKLHNPIRFSRLLFQNSEHVMTTQLTVFAVARPLN